ncbi:MAG: 2-heptaprenyl-1,4-naphthoquinone methyltransferase [Planctomycetaceae bacterium]|nr:2-heptaprenyl-1,4-naphthoquinone methyltransferase [Planctomycetaceae bacterium]
MNRSNDDHHESNRDFYDRISNAYDFIADSSEHQARETGEKALGLQAGERVLEIGYGTGNTLLDLAAMVGESGSIAGLDISTGMRDVAQRKLNDQSPAAKVDLRVGDAREMPFEDGAFDAVFASFTLELFPAEDIPPVLGEVRRVLADGGRVGIVSMAEVKEGERVSALEKVYIWMHRHFPHLVDCRPINPAAHLEAAGFQVEQQIDLDVWTMPVAVVIGRKT